MISQPRAHTTAAYSGLRPEDVHFQHLTSATQENMKTAEEINILLKSASVMKAVTSQSDLENLLGDIDHEYVLAENEIAPLNTNSKRDIRDLSDPESGSLFKRPKVKISAEPMPEHTRIKQEDGDAVWREQNEPEQQGSGEKEPFQEEVKRPTLWPTCFSCREPHNICAFPKLLPSGDCTHGREMCRMCSIAWIRSQVQEGRMPKCALCKAQMSHEFVKSVTTKKHDQEVFKL